MNKKQAVYILWEETVSINPKQRYIGGDEYAYDFEEKEITKRCRWDSDPTPETIEKAKAYIQSDMQDDYRKNVRVEVVND